MNKCEHPGCKTILFFGQEIDPCRYEDIEVHENVDLTILRCKKCGNIDFEWKRRPETVSHYLEDSI